MSEWQPIETAPRDGRIFFVWDPRVGFPAHCRWAFESSTFIVSLPIEVDGYKTGDPGQATHWMPLLEGPDERG